MIQLKDAIKIAMTLSPGKYDSYSETDDEYLFPIGAGVEYVSVNKNTGEAHCTNIIQLWADAHMFKKRNSEDLDIINRAIENPKPIENA